MLYQKALVLAKLETTFRTDASPSASTDALLVINPAVSPNITRLQRQNVKTSLSPLSARAGRKLMQLTFQHEVRNNGNLTASLPPMVGVLLQACGMEQIQLNSLALCVTEKSHTPAPSPAITWTKGGSVGASLTTPMKYRVTCVLAGASATAKVRVTGGRTDVDGPQTHHTPVEIVSVNGGTITLTATNTNPLAPTILVGGVFQIGQVLEFKVLGRAFTYTVVSGDTNINGVAASLSALIDAVTGFDGTTVSTATVTIGFTGTYAGVAITTASTAVALKAGLTGSGSGVTVTPAWTGSLTLGDYWEFEVMPIGYLYKFVSEDFASATIYTYYEEILHKMRGCRGSFTVEGTGGAYATFTFTFIGDYVRVTDEDLPASPVYETQEPTQVELADLFVGDDQFTPDGADLCASQFTIDAGVQVQPKECINAADAYDGGVIVARAPSLTFNPEATREAIHSFWQNLEEGASVAFSVQVGTDKGNTVRFMAPNIQYVDLQYADRNGTRIYNVTANMAQLDDAGDDELAILFC